MRVISFFLGSRFETKAIWEKRTMRYRIRPLELWVFSLLVAMVGVAAFHQYQESERANQPAGPYQMTVKAHRAG